MNDKWKRYNSLADLPPEKQKEILTMSDELKEDPKDPSVVLLYLEPTKEWVSIPKNAVWSPKWGLKAT